MCAKKADMLTGAPVLCHDVCTCTAATLLPNTSIRCCQQVHAKLPLDQVCRDGSLIAFLTQALENTKLNGINLSPKSTAAATHNVRKALEILRLNRKMPLDMLWSDADIVSGVPNVAVQLLWDMCCTYTTRGKFP